jgi:tRNA A-37 threonylcarbamoyl transferase component Bud32
MVIAKRVLRRRSAERPPDDSPSVSGAGRRRRPSGEPPPLPAELHTSGKYWLALGVLTVVSWIAVFAVRGAAVSGTKFDVRTLDLIASIRNDPLTEVMRAVNAVGSDWTIRIIRWAVVLALLFFKRFRHLFVFMGSILAVGWVTTTMSLAISRPRPVAIEILGHWDGPSHPSRPVAAMAVTLIGVAYTLMVPGRARTRAKWAIAVVLFVLAIARLYLAVDHVTDVIVATIVGVSIPLVAFRMLTPNEVFPVTYKRGRAAHLDIGGRRGVAIKRALEQQLGLPVKDFAPFGLGGSAGSTPLRLEMDDEAETKLFAKLYAANHLRSDRWYKLGRTLLYGRLEDEGSFSTVRRLVQYEDYMLRLMRDARLPTPQTYGFIEITPEREYVLVTELFEGSTELAEADVDDEVIDQGLGIVRILWDQGIAHRDIKPSNLLVRDKRVLLIDVAFAEARPSPWREAVDLANMMLCLALRSDAERVYQRALLKFSPEEIAEAFAATHTVTMPSQVRGMLKADGRNLLEQFRAMAPARAPISIQRWSLRRVSLTIGVVGVALFAVVLTTSNLKGAGLL